MSLIEIAKSIDIPEGQMKAFTADGKEILILHQGGKFFAMARRCPHMGGDLSLGTLDGTTIGCPRHHAHFDLQSGACVIRPKIGPLQMAARSAAVYPVLIEGETLKIEI
jgi:3-phenylpropionate/trans-cinnamate dioxygenase ferredoxin subunit